MVLTFPNYNDTLNNDTKTKKIYQSNVQYEPVYNKIYDIEPKIVNISGETIKEENVNLFDMTLSTILKNIANTLLLILMDLTNIDNYSNVKNFIKIFLIENRLMYFGIFVVLMSFYLLLFFN